MKTFENVFDTLIVILLCLLVFVVLVRGEDTIICKEVPLDSIEWMRKEVGEWLTDTSTGHWDYQGPTKEDILEILRGILDDPCPCTDTVYIVDTVYVSIDFKAAAREAARITNDQMGGEPLKSINLKEK